ncbi:MAG: trypsin-like peptidase domain-containing protein [Planctomycetes bacterium]|nr:trypsin-like peptidase domain-containing protein [Planctomycetota bacterium]
MKTLTLTLILALPLSRTVGQVNDFVDGASSVATARIPTAVALAGPRVVPMMVELPDTRPALDRAQVGAADKRLDIGYVEAFDSARFAGWPIQQRAGGGWVSRVEFHSKDAEGLRLKIVGLRELAGVKLRVYDPAGTTVLGPFTTAHTAEDGSWWSPTIFGETIGLELFVPEDIEPPSALPGIAAVAFLNCKCSFLAGTTLNCHNDVTCFSGWKNRDARAGARITFISGGSCTACSGALLNRDPGDFSPLFMTANHCINTQAEADTAELFWQYETSVCDGATTAPNPNTLPRNLGTLLVKRRSSADWTLLGLYDPPDSNAGPHWYLGWDSRSWSRNEAGIVVHHPLGSFKRISFGTTHGTQTACSFSASTRRETYTSGTTEPGSSGAPQMDSSRRVRGALSCGDLGCEINDYYARFDVAYDNLRYYLGDSYIASPVYVDDGVSGDAGNNGSTEQGSFGAPFNTVHEATYAVRSGDTIRIEPGNYDEQFRIWRPMTLKRRGSSGTVRIGD